MQFTNTEIQTETTSNEFSVLLKRKEKVADENSRDVNRLYPLRYLALKISYITADLHSSIQSLTLGVKLTTEQVLRKKMLNH